MIPCARPGEDFWHRLTLGQSDGVAYEVSSRASDRLFSLRTLRARVALGLVGRNRPPDLGPKLQLLGPKHPGDINTVWPRGLMPELARLRGRSLLSPLQRRLSMWL